MELSKEVKDILLQAARDSIKSLFDKTSLPENNYPQYPELSRINAGAFVTLTTHHQLRGCIGYLESPGKTLFDTICEAARHAAFNDPRFHPLTERELSDVVIEISILSTFTPIKDYSEIEIGVHGLLLEEYATRALLLPQVATEHHFSREQFLTAICQKAGIDSNTWKKRKLNLQVFTATVFSETERRKESYEPV
jgi:AmmeMemoRadiSam system protein A